MDSSNGAVMQILLFVLFLVVDSILFGFAAAVGYVNEGELSKKADEGDRRAGGILKLMDNGMKLSNTINITAMVMNIVVGAFVLEGISRQFGDAHYVNIITAVLTMIIVAVFGIVVPAKIAVLHSLTCVIRLYAPVSVILFILSPVIITVTFVGNCIIRLLGMNPHADNDNVTEAEILTMVNEGHEQGVIEADEAEMITNIFEFGDKEAMDIMTHRSHILAIDGNMTLEEAVAFMLHENNSRYPVYDGDIDNIIGVVHVKDALKEYGNRAKLDEPVKDISQVMYEAVLIPETRNINDLFKLMQKKKVHMVIVVDEYGQTAGLVTMEDILEEIVGNILDEHDEDEEQILAKGDDTYIADGMTLLEDLEERLDIKFDVEDIYTLNGFLIYKSGSIPDEGQIGNEIEYEGYIFKILSVENKVIGTVGIKKAGNNKEKQEQ